MAQAGLQSTYRTKTTASALINTSLTSPLRTHQWSRQLRSANFKPCYQSTLVDKPDRTCEFISAASFLGKPVATTDLAPLDEARAVSDYERWVTQQKTRWAQAYLGRHPGPRPPSLSEVAHSGHDWWFLDRCDRTGVLGLGVADGVGGWEESGEDPAGVAQSLMFYAASAFRKLDQPSRALLEEAYERMSKDKYVPVGASTALVARLDPVRRCAEWTNLGDSSLMVLKRAGASVGTQTRSQTHYFNCPFQLTKFPPHTSTDGLVIDTPEIADSGQAALDDRDVVLLSTDGLGDNLWPEEIAAVARAVLAKREPDSALVQELADTLCAHARIASFQAKRVTPFEVEARRNKVNDVRGGKVDDVTLVVSLVKHLESSKPVPSKL